MLKHVKCIKPQYALRMEMHLESALDCASMLSFYACRRSRFSRFRYIVGFELCVIAIPHF